ncbi:hypothetical protein F2P79_020380, partial [Pimephales promelas]
AARSGVEQVLIVAPFCPNQTLLPRQTSPAHIFRDGARWHLRSDPWRSWAGPTLDAEVQ